MIKYTYTHTRKARHIIHTPKQYTHNYLCKQSLSQKKRLIDTQILIQKAMQTYKHTKLHIIKKCLQVLVKNKQTQ